MLPVLASVTRFAQVSSCQVKIASAAGADVSVIRRARGARRLIAVGACARVLGAHSVLSVASWIARFCFVLVVLAGVTRFAHVSS